MYIDNRAKRASISVCCNPLFYEELATTRSKDEIRQHIYNKKRSIIGLRDRPQPTPASPPRLGGQSETNSSWHSSTLNKAVLHRALKYIQKWKIFVKSFFKELLKFWKSTSIPYFWLNFEQCKWLKNPATSSKTPSDVETVEMYFSPAGRGTKTWLLYCAWMTLHFSMWFELFFFTMERTL